MLKLEVPRDARCLVRRVVPDAFQKAQAESLWALATGGDEKRVWERLYIGDRVVIWDQYEQHFDLLAAEIVGKSLDLRVPKSERPLRLALKIHGQTRTKRLALHGYNNRDDLFCPIGEFGDMWSQCSPATHAVAPAYDPYFLTKGDLRIRVASTQADLKYIEKFAESHPFGYRKAFITLIAVDATGPVGAILAQPCLANRWPHVSSLRVFGQDYEHFRLESLAIKRIFTNDSASHKLEIQEALLLGLIEIAPFMVEGSLRLLEAVSYEPHPLTHKLGFHAEIPERSTDSIYYWRAFNLPKAYVEARAPTLPDTKLALHALVKARADLKFYGFYGRLQEFGRAERERAWALEDSGHNRGYWKSLRKGDVAFFIRDRQILEGYGVIQEIRRDTSLGRYPLRKDFSHVEMPYVGADLTFEPFAEWISLPRIGGVFPINTMGGSQLKMSIDRKQSEGKMWVVPNSYLLPGIEFTTIPKQIFVIQAWSLKDTVLPTLRDVFESEGYSVTHAEDREGQIIFGDIWKLLNEAEIVVVDFTEKRPNVYLEYGMSLVLGKPIIAISQDLKDIPSDTPQLKVILYENSMPGTKNLTQKLLRAAQDRASELRRANEQTR